MESETWKSKIFCKKRENKVEKIEMKNLKKALVALAE